MSTNTEKILSTLSGIESAHRIDILFAVESGSRMWGFESSDSDYDVRFVFVYKDIEEYVKLDPADPVINGYNSKVSWDFPLDFEGWDLRKALHLARKGNATIHEWCKSPIVYRTHPVMAKISQNLDSNLLAKAYVHHYRGMASKDLNKLMEPSLSLKKVMYTLRCIASAMYVDEFRRSPPVELGKLLFDLVGHSERYAAYAKPLAQLALDVLPSKVRGLEKNSVTISHEENNLLMEAFSKVSFHKTDLFEKDTVEEFEGRTEEFNAIIKESIPSLNKPGIVQVKYL